MSSVIVMEIADQRVAYIHYILTDDKGEVLDRSERDAPLAYLHGAGNIIPGLEKALAGRGKGDKLEVTVPPEEAYGVHREDLIQQVPRRMFKGVGDLKVGMRLRADSDHGPQIVTVTNIAGDMVTLDGNHALAGRTLHFAVEIAEVRTATPEEMTHGHVHGAGGHHH
jgi:FKBP-type peptidyl-prolyl cis-trans isomerase SlyD